MYQLAMEAKLASRPKAHSAKLKRDRIRGGGARYTPNTPH